MGRKVVVVDVDWTTAFPENALYLGARLLRRVPARDLRIVKFARPEDEPVLCRALQDLAGDEALVIFNFDYFNLFDFQVQALRGLLADLATSRSVVTAACGLLPSAAESLFVSSGLFDHVVTGYPWSQDLGDLFEPSPDSAHVLQTKPLREYPPNGLDFFESIHCLANVGSCLCHDQEGPYFYYYTSRMCNNGCFFCINCTFLDRFGGRVTKDPALVERELDFLGPHLGVRRLIIADEQTRFASLELAVAKGYRLAQFGARFCAKDFTPEILRFAAANGCRIFALPVETLNRGILSSLKKNYSQEHLDRILSAARELGLFADAFYIFGLPCRDGALYGAEDLARDVALLGDLLRRYPNVGVHARPFMPLPGTQLGDKDLAWRQSEGLDLFDWLETVAVVLNGEPLADSAWLPKVYADPETYAAASQARASFLALHRHFTSLYFLPPRNPAKAALCDLLTRHVLELMEQGRYEAGEFLNQALDQVAKLT